MRPARNGLAFDDSAVIADHLGDKCKSKATSLSLGRDEGIEQVRQQVRGHAGTIVADADFERQSDAARGTGELASPGSSEQKAQLPRSGYRAFRGCPV